MIFWNTGQNRAIGIKISSINDWSPALFIFSKLKKPCRTEAIFYLLKKTGKMKFDVIMVTTTRDLDLYIEAIHHCYPFGDAQRTARH